MPEWKIKTRVRKCLKRWRVYFCYFLSFPISVGQISFAMCVFSIVKFIILLKCLHFAGFELTEREPKNEICIRSKDTRGAERLRCEDEEKNHSIHFSFAIYTFIWPIQVVQFQVQYPQKICEKLRFDGLFAFLVVVVVESSCTKYGLM